MTSTLQATTTIVRPSLADIEDAFFSAMQEGWARGSYENPSPGNLPGSKTFTYPHGDFKVIDRYYTTVHSDLSDVSTMILHLEQLVWIMHYGGRYDKAAIPFLKQCLQKAYDKRHFLGGRGDAFVQGDVFTYTNRTEYSEFGKFSGMEQVHNNQTGVCQGYHWYRGMSLIR